MTDAVGYLRKSSAPSRRVRTVSFEVQESDLRALAERNGDTVGDILSDWGRSGGNTRRPDYQRLLTMIESGAVRTVYSYSLSRLSRSLIDFADLLERCRAHDVRIRLVQEGEIDTKSATGRAFANMAATFAQFERELAVERNQAAVAERRERGDVLGQAPYGYRIEAGRLVRRDDEDPAMVATAYQEARSFGGAAKLLNEWDVPTRRHGTKWNHGTVADILRYEVRHDRLSGTDVGLAVARPRAKAAALSGAYFAGLLACPCGGTLTPRKDDGAPSGVSGYYCSRATRQPHRKMHVAERVILDWARPEAARLAVPYRLLEIVKAADNRLQALDRKRAKVVDLYLEEIVSKVERDRRLAELDAEADALRVKTALVDIPPAVDWTWPPDRVNAVLRALWSCVELDADLRPTSAEWLVPEWRA